jgi:hypothetical protein
MALHLNLYHEIAQERVERRRDPLKLGVYGLILIGVCLAGYYLFRLNSVRLVRGDLKLLKADWEELSKREKVAMEREKELIAKREVVENLKTSIDTRFLWASFLQKFGECVPRNIQITRMTADVTPDKQLTVNIEGVAAGLQPRTEAENFRVTLAKVFGERYPQADSTFRSLEDAAEPVRLDGRELEVANFSIRVAVDATGGPINGVPDKRLSVVGDVKP